MTHIQNSFLFLKRFLSVPQGKVHHPLLQRTIQDVYKNAMDVYIIKLLHLQENKLRVL
jgi:hypothetical protein